MLDIFLSYQINFSYKVPTSWVNQRSSPLLQTGTPGNLAQSFPFIFQYQSEDCVICQMNVALVI